MDLLFSRLLRAEHTQFCPFFELLGSQDKRPFLKQPPCSQALRLGALHGGCFKKIIERCVLYPHACIHIHVLNLYVLSIWTRQFLLGSELVGVTRTLCNPTHWQLSRSEHLHCRCVLPRMYKTDPNECARGRTPELIVFFHNQIQERLRCLG